ncbi:MAG: hypothetical protein AAGF92_08315 [Myxococcota bacterium]
MAALGDKLVDIRIIERNIEKGLITKEEYERHLAELADRDGEYDTVEIETAESKDTPEG